MTTIRCQVEESFLEPTCSLLYFKRFYILALFVILNSVNQNLTLFRTWQYLILNCSNNVNQKFSWANILILQPYKYQHNNNYVVVNFMEISITRILHLIKLLNGKCNSFCFVNIRGTSCVLYNVILEIGCTGY